MKLTVLNNFFQDTGLNVSHRDFLPIADVHLFYHIIYKLHLNCDFFVNGEDLAFLALEIELDAGGLLIDHCRQSNVKVCAARITDCFAG